MYVSSPVSQICIALAIQFKNESDTEECLNLMSEISTNDPETNSKSFNEKLQQFLKKLSTSKNLVFYTSSFVAYYFEQRKHEEMYDIFTKLMIEYTQYKDPISTYDAGYLCGIFSTALMSDLGLNDKQDIPKDIREAIKYIESENFIVHLEKNVK